MGYFLGIDGGGSKTAVWCADEKGQIVGRGKSGPTNLTTTDASIAIANLHTAINQAVERLVTPQFESVVMGLAGMDTADEVVLAQQVFKPVFDRFQIAQLSLVNDAFIALKSGSDAANAMVVIAGTGSNCLGRNAQGREAKAGGLDYWLSDEGSGFAIGSAVLRAVVQAADGRGPATVLTRQLEQHLQVASVAELKKVVYGAAFSKREMAELAKLAVRAAENGDGVAYTIMSQAIQEIQRLIEAVTTQLQFEHQIFDCVMIGSINSLGFVRTRLSIWFARQYPQGRLLYPEKPPVFGAVQMAYQAAFLAGPTC